jgi:SAM-dependent methyltransferase
MAARDRRSSSLKLTARTPRWWPSSCVNDMHSEDPEAHPSAIHVSNRPAAAPCDHARVREYYDSRAPEYDEWYLGLGGFQRLARPGWEQDLHALERTIASLPAASVLDVACGTGFLTRHLRGHVTLLDQSERMLEIARERMPGAPVIRADALDLPFEDDSFDRIFAGHFYGHLETADREQFLTEARRVAPELVIVDTTVRPDRGRAEWEQRVLNDGSRFEVYKRYFTGSELANELGDGTVLLENRWFVAVTSPRP